MRDPTASPEYAALVAAYGPGDAMKMLLASALAEWRARYTPRTSFLLAPDYPATGGYLGTTRRLPEAVVADIRRRFDPLDRRADGWIAQRIAISAISDYLGRH